MTVDGAVKFERTYQIENPPEPAMKWEVYERVITAAWDTVLNGESPAEKPVQAFLEQHPSMSLTQKRAYLHADDVVAVTYDRLRPNPGAGQLVCMRPDAKGVFTAISVPPTLKWLPGLAQDRALLRGLDAAIAANSYISQVRKDFLVHRLAYWNEWAGDRQCGVINSADEEVTIAIRRLTSR